ncbi:MAG: type II CRISPR-associated endonuclease Cas1 [Saprospiraceae bacterium]|jgi:CRISPR-associated protein Cas1|nr:type II CRISPR-associated endonuclease Cas1 [Saprospiraceae bacterium]MBL0025628.1 type II CRISPR-associated endonuclease Cas1 [Saprospiraceae bacterium]
MIKRTIYFGSPAYLFIKNKQLCIKKSGPSDEEVHRIPIEDIGIVVADHIQVTFTHSVITSLQENNAVIVWCGSNHMPVSMCLPMSAHDTFSEKVKWQIEASEPLKKQLWKQTITAKIKNQISILRYLGRATLHMDKMVTRINSGDPENYEGQAAAIYWNELLRGFDVTRGRYEGGPNQLFNYGYAILRAVIARNLVGSGCLPVLGIHHTNKYNAFCLADDIMEPYRPVIDKLVVDYLGDKKDLGAELTKDDKAYLLQIPAIDILIEGKMSPLMVGAQRTTASLVKCYQGTARKIIYPDISC